MSRIVLLVIFVMAGCAAQPHAAGESCLFTDGSFGTAWPSKYDAKGKCVAPQARVERATSTLTAWRSTD